MSRRLKLSIFSLTLLALAFSTMIGPTRVSAEGGDYIGGAAYRPGDIDGDGRDDLIRYIAFVGPSGGFVIDLTSNGHPTTPPFPNERFYQLWGHLPMVGDFDGDGLIDLAAATGPLTIPLETNTSIQIDYARNGFTHGLTAGDETHTYYGSVATPDPRMYVAADYDGDGKTDFSRLDHNSYVNASYRIDYAANGFGSWDVVLPNYGYNTAQTYVWYRPAGGDFDGDGKADVSVQNTNGQWRIDYAANGFGSWDVQYFGGYVGGSAIPYAADITGDGKADLALRPDDGRWLWDFSTDGFGALNQSTTYSFAPWASSQAPGDFDGDGKADLFFVSDCWYGGCGWLFNVDYAWNGPTPAGDAWTNPGPYLSRLTNERRNPRYFVRQMYLDFLNHVPDQGGWDFWRGQIASCGANLSCSAGKRIDVARAFFYSGEFIANNPILAAENRGTPTYNREFVRQCYLGFLRREPDQGGWDFWTNKLNNAGSPTPEWQYNEMLNAFIVSGEYHARDNMTPLWIPN